MALLMRRQLRIRDLQPHSRKETVNEGGEKKSSDGDAGTDLQLPIVLRAKARSHPKARLETDFLDLVTTITVHS
jgi:hypothetical protein